MIGATSGIGWELARVLAAQRYMVGITGRRKEKLEELHASAPERFVIRAFDCTQDDNRAALRA